LTGGKLRNRIVVPSGADGYYSVILTEVSAGGKTTIDVPTGNPTYAPDAVGEKTFSRLTHVGATFTAEAPTNGSVNSPNNTSGNKRRGFQTTAAKRGNPAGAEVKTVVHTYSVGEGRANFAISRQPRILDEVSSSGTNSDFRGPTLKNRLLTAGSNNNATTITVSTGTANRLVAGMTLEDVAWENAKVSAKGSRQTPTDANGTTITASAFPDGTKIESINYGTGVITLDANITRALVTNDLINFISPWKFIVNSCVVTGAGTSSLVATTKYTLSKWGNGDCSGDIILLNDYISN